jgi:murein L,D-transpeptidase YcbB/YkuD
MSLDRSRSEPEGERGTSVRPVDGASAEQQILSLHSAIGNVAFSQVVSRSLAARLSRKNIGSKRGGTPPASSTPPDFDAPATGLASKRGGKGGHKRGGGGAPAKSSDSGMLRRGSRGPRVTTLQMDLSVYGGYPIAVDGIFGPETDGAVRSFQQGEGLDADGIVGPLTSAALNERKGSSGLGRLKWNDVTLKRG